MTWLFRAAITILLVFSGLYLFSRFDLDAPFISASLRQSDWMTVSGEGKVTVVPDTGLVDIGVRVMRPKIRDTQTEANKTMNGIIDILKGMGIDEKDIKTSSYSIYPRFEWLKKQRLVGYEVSIDTAITVRSLDKVDEVIDAATANGANRVGHVRLIVNEEIEKAYRQKARELAVNDAKEKAVQIVSAAGISLGRLVKVQEEELGQPPVYYELYREAKETAVASKTHVMPGMNDIVSRVTLFYEIR